MNTYENLNGCPQPMSNRNPYVRRNSFVHQFCGDDGTRFDPIALGRNIRRSGSHIYFYDEVDPESQLLLEIMLRDAIRDVLTEHVGEILGGELPESVTIHINSPGGVGSSGLALYDYIKTSQIPITCVVEGICASAATLIMLACPVRVMSPNSEVLIHQCSWGGWGNNRYMQDMAKNAESSMRRIRAIYMKETSIGADRPDNEREAYIQHLLEHDWFLSTEECEKYGITTAHDEDDDDVELSEDRVERLQDFVKKLAIEQKAENAKVEKKAATDKASKSKKSKPRANKSSSAPVKNDESKDK